MSDVNNALDITMLESLKELLGEKFTIMLDAYFSDGEERITRMRYGFSQSNLSIVKDEAHGIKGSSYNIGAGSLAALCEVVEAQARKNDTQGLEQKITAIEQSFAAVCGELNKLRS